MKSIQLVAVRSCICFDTLSSAESDQKIISNGFDATEISNWCQTTFKQDKWRLHSRYQHFHLIPNGCITFKNSSAQWHKELNLWWMSSNFTEHSVTLDCNTVACRIHSWKNLLHPLTAKYCKSVTVTYTIQAASNGLTKVLHIFEANIYWSLKC